jgi:two-component system, NtrC family, sensor kinase
MGSQPKNAQPDFKGIGYSKIGFFKETRDKIKELETLNIELEKRHNKLEAIFNSISDGLTILDQYLTIVFVNQVQKANFPGAPLLGEKCYRAFFKKEHACRNCPAVRAALEQVHLTGEIFVDGPDDSGRYFEWATCPVRDPCGRVYEVILLMRDITSRKEYEYKLMQADRMAAIGFLAAGVAHEINNPLTSIAGFSEALLKRLKHHKQDSNRGWVADLSEYLEIINAEAYRCKDIICNLQDFSRNASDDFDTLSIDAIIRNTLSLFRQRAKDHNVRIRYDTDFEAGGRHGDTGDTINGKNSQLKHLFLNLFTRAFKSVENGGDILIRASSDDRQIHISLSDIALSDKQNRGCHAGFDDFSGWEGEVDLSICYNIVHHHKGVLQYAQSDRSGPVLTIVFPRSR